MASTPVSEEDRKKAIDWLHKFHQGGDALDIEAFVSNFKEDAKLTFAEQPPIIGKAAIKKQFGAQFALLKSMKHIINEVDVLPDKIHQSCIIRYVVKGDPKEEEIDVRGFAVLYKGLGDKQMHRFDVYGDFSKLVGKIEEVVGSSKK